MADLFAFFSGGREGVKQRFAEIIRSALENRDGREIAAIEAAVELSPGTLQAVLSGHREPINFHLITSLAAVIGIGIDEGFGEVVELDDETAQRFTDKANEEGFAMIAGCNAGSISPSHRLRLWTLLKALEQL